MWLVSFINIKPFLNLFLMSVSVDIFIYLVKVNIILYSIVLYSVLYYYIGLYYIT
jgi:hypothetical protein